MAGTASYPSITMYSAQWCGDCHRSKRLLDRHNVPYTEIDIEEHPETVPVIAAMNNGKRKLPTIVIEGGLTLFEPSDPDLARALGIKL